jgi:hypothetical protein
MEVFIMAGGKLPSKAGLRQIIRLKNRVLISCGHFQNSISAGRPGTNNVAESLMVENQNIRP